MLVMWGILRSGFGKGSRPRSRQVRGGVIGWGVRAALGVPEVEEDCPAAGAATGFDIPPAVPTMKLADRSMP